MKTAIAILFLMLTLSACGQVDSTVKIFPVTMVKGICIWPPAETMDYHVGRGKIHWIIGDESGIIAPKDTTGLSNELFVQLLLQANLKIEIIRP